MRIVQGQARTKIDKKRVNRVTLTLRHVPPIDAMQRRANTPLRSAAIALAISCANVAHGAGIVPDGGTATSVTTAPDGKVTVNIAPPVSGVSHNTFTQFNIGKPGADLINTGVNARTIVTEVTSTNPSLIEGQIAIIGPRANLIIANPNGVTVNGGSFINTGTLAISTGRVSFHDFQPAPGFTQRNVILDTSAGAIEIGPDGLSGAFNNLELIAKTLKVSGKIENTFTNANAGIRAVIGNSRAEFDTSVSPTDGLSQFVSYSTPSAANAGSIAVDITPLGSLVAGKVALIITDQGAGVRHAGSTLAKVGDFTILSSGDVNLIGSAISANSNISINAGNVILQADSTGRGANVVAAEGGVTIDAAGNVTNNGGLIQGKQRDSSNVVSEGAVTLKTGASFLNESPNATTLAAIFGSDDDVVIRSQGDIVNRSARIISNRRLILAAQGDIANVIDKQSGANGEQRVDFRTSESAFLLFKRTRSGFNVDHGALPLANQLAFLVADGDIDARGRNIVNSGGEIYANNGSMNFVAQQKFTNEALASGQVQFERKCMIVCKTTASSTVTATGGLISSSRDIVITAGTEAANIGGRVLALNDLTVTAPRVTVKGITGYSVITRDKGMKAWFGDTWGQIFAADVGGSFTANRGRLIINGALYVDGGEVSGGAGVEVNGETIVLRAAQREPVAISNNLGLSSWLWR
ncbi:MAG TPA: filamentous hemagglutinin N-terminal domain-containing protein [Burkholderiales bacterium]|nr:filamentous hemagglutinin N-terminal domain-containing protein [Burkholderiales bacterium]